MVLVIVAILAAVATPRLFDSNNTLIAQAYKLANDLRHIQTIAMSQGRTLNLNVQSVSTYSVTFGGSTITDPATLQPYTVTLDNNVKLNGADTEIDSMGRPVANGNLLAVERTFVFSDNNRKVLVTLSPVTGFVAVLP